MQVLNYRLIDIGKCDKTVLVKSLVESIVHPLDVSIEVTLVQMRLGNCSELPLASKL